MKCFILVKCHHSWSHCCLERSCNKRTIDSSLESSIWMWTKWHRCQDIARWQGSGCELLMAGCHDEADDTWWNLHCQWNNVAVSKGSCQNDCLWPFVLPYFYSRQVFHCATCWQDLCFPSFVSVGQSPTTFAKGDHLSRSIRGNSNVVQ